jgi:hypothetical protein
MSWVAMVVAAMAERGKAPGRRGSLKEEEEENPMLCDDGEKKK